jgi:hypothetical protein
MTSLLAILYLYTAGAWGWLTWREFASGSG